MLSAKGIYKNYGDLPILKGIDITINRQEVVCIVGASGAGKTTLLQILGTLDRPDQGSITLNDEDVLNLSGKKLAHFRNTKIGFIFQFHQLLPEFTAIENVIIPALLGNKSKQEASKRAEELLSFLSLSDRIHHKPSELSGGEQQRVAVLRALIHQPLLLLADEPTGNLDTDTSRKVMKLLTTLVRKEQKTLVLVTHNQELAQSADRVFRIRDGRLIQVNMGGSA